MNHTLNFDGAFEEGPVDSFEVAYIEPTAEERFDLLFLGVPAVLIYRMAPIR